MGRQQPVTYGLFLPLSTGPLRHAYRGLRRTVLVATNRNQPETLSYRPNNFLADHCSDVVIGELNRRNPS